MILANDRECVAAYVVGKIRHMEPFVTGYEALGAIDRDGRLIGGFVYSELRRCPGGGSIAICAAGERDWLTRGNLAVFLHEYPFQQLGCHRIQAQVALNNHRARNVIKRLGFKEEGKLRSGFGPGKDAIVYSLLRSETKWLR